ncbi:6,7-dimethyl-8-ribityllumazine synthase [Oscillibacter valericigenes Sjm18-20]|nr:6,7-dimethyl-8-ribityllumazine synthase [Oscillibacter valericigenes Sjm18-20]
MFTGMIEEVGTILAVRWGAHSSALSVRAGVILSDLKIGDSVAVNGVCLTATAKTAGGFTADVMHETLNRSTLGALTVGCRVNLERAMAVNGRFGGHIVSGHIDGTGRISKIHRDDIALWYTVEAPPELLRFLVEKGSVALDGISLTVAAVSEKDFSVSVIPHTAAATSLSESKAGDRVNLETDLIGKYVEKLLGMTPEVPKRPGITPEYLLQNGF